MLCGLQHRQDRCRQIRLNVREGLLLAVLEDLLLVVLCSHDLQRAGSNWIVALIWQPQCMFDKRVVIPPCWRITPVLSATEVALRVHEFTAGAQWNEPAMRPLVLWEMIITPAAIAEVRCDQAAINAGHQTWVARLELLQGHLIELNSDISSLIS